MLYNRGYGSVEYRSVEDVLTIEFTQRAARDREAGDRNTNDGDAIHYRRYAGGDGTDSAADAEQQV